VKGAETQRRFITKINKDLEGHEVVPKPFVVFVSLVSFVLKP
jgi:hypothetical protein